METDGHLLGPIRGAIDPWYVTGFTEGEGCFTFNRSDRNFTLVYAIKLNETDLAILEDIQNYFGCGRIYHVTSRGPLGPSTGFTKPAKYFRISRILDLIRVIQHFDAYPLRGVKAMSYQIWRQMVEIKLETYKKPDRVKLQELAHTLSAIAVRNRTWRP